MKRTKIAIVLPSLAGGGAERIHIELASAFIARGLDVDLVLFRASGELMRLVPEDSCVVDLGAQRLRNAFFPLTSYLRRERPRAILAAMWPVTAIAILASKFARVPVRVIVSDHTTLSSTFQARGATGRILRASLRWIYPMADRRVAVSVGVRDDLYELGVRRSVRVEVIENPIASATPSSAPEVQEDIGWLDANPRVLAVGSLKPAKDYPTLLWAFRQVVGRNPHARLLILGDGPLRSELLELTRRLGLVDSVTMPGFVTNPGPYYHSADLFVLSSAWEGFGNVIVEALSAGTPVVSTDCRSGPREILVDGKYGRLVPVGDADALASAILESLIAEHDSEVLRQRALDFRPDVATARYLELLTG